LPIIGFAAELVFYPGHPFELGLGDPFRVLVLALPMLSAAVFFRFGHIHQMLMVRLSAGELIERELLHLSLHDRLTGLPNRASLEREIERFAAARRKGSSRPAFLLLDLDKFKHVNDTLGHDAGDELLQLFSIRITGLLGAQVRLFRLGGDEFVVTVAGSPADADLERLCRSLQARAAEPFELRAGRAVIGVSIGIAYLEADDQSLPEVMKRADLALYAAKDIAGSAHVFHDRVLAGDMQERMRTEQEIASGLLHGEFFVEYQPVVSAETREVAAFEALARWRHPRRGVLAPEHFLPIAERSGHIMALGRFVLGRAIEDAGRWPPAIGVAVNVTGDEFRDPRFVGDVKALLEIHGVAPERLTIEITETAFTIDTATIQKGLADLSTLGVKVAIDDFGMGFSSINHLRQFPIDRLKVDRSFTQAMLQGGRDTELVSIMLRLGQIFGVRTTVEGVENEDQLEAARALGAADVQGFLISRPLPATAACALACSRSGLPAEAAFRFSA
jgi:diguanylate cyclase (GGDEF)-like protein